MNLASLNTQTSVTFNTSYRADRLFINGKETDETTLARASLILDHVRLSAGLRSFAEIESWNNFPTGVGIASSASGFAALASAATSAAGLELNEPDLSRLARRASGSACRSIPAGFVEWQAGIKDEDSYAFSIAPDSHWALVDCIAVVSSKPKTVSSIEGHNLANSSPLQTARILTVGKRLQICRTAIQHRDFLALAEVMELDSNMMHAVMMTSTPPLLYWLPATIRIMHAVTEWRREGIPVCFTIDAGPNVHVICEHEYADRIAEYLRRLDGVETVFTSEAGGPTRIIPTINLGERAC